MRPVSIFDLFVEYRVLSVNPRISANLMCAMKAEILHGFPAGCLKALSGSPVSQYSSSHSTGYSMSKLMFSVRRKEIRVCR